MEEIERLVQFSAKTEGRDKIFRTVQYGARFFSAVLGPMGKTDAKMKDVVARLTKLSSVMSDGRKLFRLYKSLNEVPKFPGIWTSKENTMMKSLQSAKSISTFLYFVYDNLTWAAKYQLIKQDSTVVARRSGVFWFFSLLFQVVVDLWNYTILQAQTHKLLTAQTVDLENTKKLEAKRFALHLSLLKNFCDIPIAANAGFKGKLSTGVTGFLGLVSSLVGLYQLYPARTVKKE